MTAETKPQTSNSGGSYRTTLHNKMKAFDKLPPSARRALVRCAFDWAPQPYATYFKRGAFRTEENLAEYIEMMDDRLVGEKAFKTYGAGHPQAES